jgi:NADPH:quinone reductase-like Zn-dependent oxidoreductase
MLIFGDTDSARNAVQLVFAGERVRSQQATPNPALNPQQVQVQGRTIQIIPIADLVRTRFSAFRDKDRVHVRGMDAAGLITAEVEDTLTPELLGRLQTVRDRVDRRPLTISCEAGYPRAFS